MPKPPRALLTTAQIRVLVAEGQDRAFTPQEIRALREAVDLTRPQLARRLQFAPATARSWERTDAGQRLMRRATRIAFCRIIDRILADPYADAA